MSHNVFLGPRGEGRSDIDASLTELEGMRSFKWRLEDGRNWVLDKGAVDREQTERQAVMVMDVDK
jgi:hypothetical protein